MWEVNEWIICTVPDPVPALALGLLILGRLGCWTLDGGGGAGYDLEDGGLGPGRGGFSEELYVTLLTLTTDSSPLLVLFFLGGGTGLSLSASSSSPSSQPKIYTRVKSAATYFNLNRYCSN